MKLVLERKDQENTTAHVGPVVLAPSTDENYWSHRVRLTDAQSLVAFPKFRTFGIGFAVEEEVGDRNLPYTCDTEKIYNHIKINVGDEEISREMCIEAIKMLQVAVDQDLSPSERRWIHYMYFVNS
ncbi:hypothetical protein [Rhodococcus qingshengii]|uniref:hypothetical protein n=1 Tax=Rhodococcus qingshengii TaxID=334542 RepID=UPI0035D67507